MITLFILRLLPLYNIFLFFWLGSAMEVENWPRKSSNLLKPFSWFWNSLIMGGTLCMRIMCLLMFISYRLCGFMWTWSCENVSFKWLIYSLSVVHAVSLIWCLTMCLFDIMVVTFLIIQCISKKTVHKKKVLCCPFFLFLKYGPAVYLVINCEIKLKLMP